MSISLSLEPRPSQVSCLACSLFKPLWDARSDLILGDYHPTYTYTCLRNPQLIDWLSQFQLTDVNGVSVLTYGVTGIKDSNNNLTIKEVRVVSHTGCAGVQACYNVVNNLPSLPPPDSVLLSWTT
jgi:hypothetical protein